jgi:hypothetical protein
MSYKAMILLLFLILFLVKPSFASNYTYNTNTTCVGKVCTVAIGGSYALDGSTWKTIDKAKSLKNSSVQCDVNSDGSDIATCLDWNTSFITVNLTQANALSIVQIPVKVWIPNYTKSSDYHQGTLVSNINVSVSRSSSTTRAISFAIGDVLEYGANSTTITLNESNSGNLGDTEVKTQSSPYYNWGASATITIASNLEADLFFLWNMSVVPAGSTISNVNMSAYISAASGYTTTIDTAYNTSPMNTTGTSYWNEGTLSNTYCGSGPATPLYPQCNLDHNITWQYKPATGTYQDNKTVGKSTGFQYFNVTNAAITAFANTTYQRMSITLKTSDALTHVYVSKEGATASQRPQLVITYTAGGGGGTTYNQSAADSFTYTDTKSTILIRMEKLVNGGTYSDLSSTISNFYRSSVDTPSYSDVNSVSSTFLKSLIESPTYSDALSKLRSVIISLIDSFIYAEAKSNFLTGMRSLTESFAYGDAMSNFKKAYASLAESMTYKDLTSIVSSIATTFTEKLSDAFSYFENTKRFKTAFSSMTESFNYADAISKFQLYYRSIMERLTYIDNSLASRIAGAVTYTEKLVDSFIHSDTVTNFKSVFKSLTESLTYSDTLSKIRTAFNSIADSFIYSDQAQKVLSIYRSLSDSFAYGESLAYQKLLAYITYVINLVEKSTYWDKFIGFTTSTSPIIQSSLGFITHFGLQNTTYAIIGGIAGIMMALSIAATHVFKAKEDEKKENNKENEQEKYEDEDDINIVLD